MSPWLRGARADGGLRIPGRPSRRAADLILAPDEAVVAVGDVRSALAWDDHGHHWSLREHQTWRSYGTVRIAVAVAASTPGAATVRARAVPWWERLGATDRPEVVVPLGPLRPRDQDLALVTALCGLLAERPVVRRRLADDQRVTRLVHDLVSWAPAGPPAPAQAMVEPQQVVLDALGHVGCLPRHGGRPVGGDPVPGHEAVVAEVQAHLAGDPLQPLVSRPWVDDMVRAAVTAVEPWPFGALTTEQDG